MPLVNGPLGISEPMIGGHYNADGRWVQTKFCFVSCGDRCDCMPPDGVFQLPPTSISIEPLEGEMNG